jgi:hypothetical protein
MIKYPICQKCANKITCGDENCAAVDELYRINRQKKIASQRILIKNLARKLDIHDVEVSPELRRLGRKVINRFDEFSFIKAYGIKIEYLVSYENKNGEKITYAECRKIPEVYKAFLPYDFLITYFDRNTSTLTANQKKILMLHELKHVGLGMKGLRIIPHDIEDFSDILRKYGLKWNKSGEELPDILKD